MSIPVINVVQMREWENATWATGQTEAEVIRRVGRKIAGRVGQITNPDDLILILAGSGHNGGDARAAQEFLTGRRIELLEVFAPENDLPRLEQALRQKPALIIDGLFGVGLNRPLDDGWKKFIATVNESKIPVLAVDVPSGLNADTGEPQGAAIEAAITLTVGAPKIGLLSHHAWPFVGRLEIADDVGLIPCPPRVVPHPNGIPVPQTDDLNWIVPEDFAGFPPRRASAAHKGTFGHLAIVAGSFGFHGAAVLSARGARRAQPGLITLFTQENVYHVIASQLQSVMVSVWTPAKELLDAAGAALIGPGLAAPNLPPEMKAIFRRLWRDSELPLIVDASVLDWIAPHTVSKDLLRVVTPHPGEAARLLNSTVEKVQANRVEALREISRRFGNCWVVLKGHQTFVGRSEGEISVNPSGNPHLAQGGSGDVLSGFIAGLLVQPALRADAGKTIRYAVWQHGAAADKLQAARKNWTVEDLIVELGNAR
jgi:NAD(P)H-hydrate epimerase